MRSIIVLSRRLSLDSTRREKSSSSPTVKVPHSFDPQFGIRSEAADFIAMLATAEAFKLIAGYAENPSQATIEFDGYESRVRVNP